MHNFLVVVVVIIFFFVGWGWSGATVNEVKLQLMLYFVDSLASEARQCYPVLPAVHFHSFFSHPLA